VALAPVLEEGQGWALTPLELEVERRARKPEPGFAEGWLLVQTLLQAFRLFFGQVTALDRAIYIFITCVADGLFQLVRVDAKPRCDPLEEGAIAIVT
jgi:hypothetical protein